MKNPPLIIAFIIVLVGGTFWYFGQSDLVGVTPEEEDAALLEYANETYGISFEYPDTYEVQERELGTGQREHFAITLIDREDLANIPINGEGPPTINVEVFQNNLDNLTIEEWVRGTNFSNFTLSPDGAIREANVAGAPALAYQWDGLYRGESIVFEHEGSIIMLSMQYRSGQDPIVQDFPIVSSSLRLR